MVGELAGVLEVLRALAEDSGVDWFDVESAAHDKAAERGASREGWFLESLPDR